MHLLPVKVSIKLPKKKKKSNLFIPAEWKPTLQPKFKAKELAFYEKKKQPSATTVSSP